jgi:hypothetical protein
MVKELLADIHLFACPVGGTQYPIVIPNDFVE